MTMSTNTNEKTIISTGSARLANHRKVRWR